MIRRGHRASRQRGVALLLVLWAFMILGVLALDFGRYMRDDAMGGANFAEEAQGYYTAYAGMQTALWKARKRIQNPGADDTTAQAQGEDEDEDEELVRSESGTFHGMSYTVEVRPECGRIPINKLAQSAGNGNAEDREFLKQVITNLVNGGNATKGMDTRTATKIDEVVDSIIDWIDANGTEGVNGTESQWYLDNRGYPASNTRLRTVDELLKIRGVTPELYYGVDGRPGLRDIVSVYCGFNDSGAFGEGMMDPRAIDGKVLQVLSPEMTEDEQKQLMAQRDTDKVAFAAGVVSQLGKNPIVAAKINPEPDQQTTLVAVTARADTSKDRNQSAIAGVFTLEANDIPEPVIWYDRAPLTDALPSGDIPAGDS
jgi:hypothetical protein